MALNDQNSKLKKCITPMYNASTVQGFSRNNMASPLFTSKNHIQESWNSPVSSIGESRIIRKGRPTTAQFGARKKMLKSVDKSLQQLVSNTQETLAFSSNNVRKAQLPQTFNFVIDSPSMSNMNSTHDLCNTGAPVKPVSPQVAKPKIKFNPQKRYQNF